jgi:hypothetical protein
MTHYVYSTCIYYIVLYIGKVYMTYIQYYRVIVTCTVITLCPDEEVKVGIRRERVEGERGEKQGSREVAGDIDVMRVTTPKSMSKLPNRERERERESGRLDGMCYRERERLPGTRWKGLIAHIIISSHPHSVCHPHPVCHHT